MAYLNCPSCRLTVYSPTPGLSSEDARCRAKLGSEQVVPIVSPGAAAEATNETARIQSLWNTLTP
jgi:hypothetical protein